VQQEIVERLKTMLGVEISRIEEDGEQLVVFTPKSQIAKAIGSSGSVVRAAELVLKRKIVLKETEGQGILSHDDK
jgi:transcription antitermination factor NusA-like protein